MTMIIIHLSTMIMESCVVIIMRTSASNPNRNLHLHPNPNLNLNPILTLIMRRYHQDVCIEPNWIGSY